MPGFAIAPAECSPARAEVEPGEPGYASLSASVAFSAESRRSPLVCDRQKPRIARFRVKAPPVKPLQHR